MLDKSVTLLAINLFLQGLAEEFRQLDSSITVVHFGSSLNSLTDENLDIDVLLISKNSYFDNQINKIIAGLKESLLSGKNVQGFSTENKQIQRACDSYIKKQTIFLNSSIFPQYIFGPFPQSLQLSNSNIFLHFKGPLTKEEFLLFCKELPFHGYSIIDNHKVIRGDFDGDYFFKEIELNRESLTQFNQGLKNRIESTTSLSEARKCINKIILNNKVFQNDKSKIPFLDLSNINDISILREMFDDLFAPTQLTHKHGLCSG